MILNEKKGVAQAKPGDVKQAKVEIPPAAFVLEDGENYLMRNGQLVVAHQYTPSLMVLKDYTGIVMAVVARVGGRRNPPSLPDTLYDACTHVPKEEVIIVNVRATIQEPTQHLHSPVVHLWHHGHDGAKNTEFVFYKGELQSVRMRP